MQIKVSEFIVNYMERLGIECIFGMPGAHILPVYDALYDSPIQAVLAKHEQGAAFMAGGYAKSSGSVSACIATAGPGATNLITGIANAYADRLPVLAVTGEAPTYIFGKGGLQESSGEGGSISQADLFRSITRYCRVVERVDYLPQVLTQAANALLSPTPGPVLLTIPYNVQNELIDADLLDSVSMATRATPAIPSLPMPPLRDLARLVLDAEHPVIIAGYGSIRSGAHGSISRLSALLNIPVASSLKGKGIIDERSALALGSLGVTSNGHAYRYILEKADLLIVLGAGFNERTSYLWDEALLGGRKIVQVDSDPGQLEKVFHAEIAICGDIDATISALLEEIETRIQNRPDDGATATRVAEEKRTSNADWQIFKSGFSLAEAFFQHLREHFQQEAVVFDDNIIFAQNFYDVSEHTNYYPNSGISSLGHAIPAAIGAQFHRTRPCFAVIGDGGFQMCCMEIMTAVNYAKPLNVVLFNNGTMGLIRKNQHQLYNRRFINADFVNPDYASLAHAFGINYKKITQLSDLDALFDTFDLEHTINLIDIEIDKDAFPNYSSKR